MRRECHLLLTAAQHADDAETDGLDGQGRRPVVRQDRHADVAVTVDVWVDRNVGTNKKHLQQNNTKRFFFPDE